MLTIEKLWVHLNKIHDMYLIQYQAFHIRQIECRLSIWKMWNEAVSRTIFWGNDSNDL